MTAYALKCRNEDFKVAEVPLDPFGAGADGDFTYVWLRKDGVTTFAAVEAVAAYFRLAPGDVEAAGLKDEDAITRQLVSVRQRLALSDLTAFNAAHAQITLDAIQCRAHEPLTARELHGNVFDIRIRALDAAVAEAIVATTRTRRLIPVINYYDRQRFGTPGSAYRTAEVGEALTRGEWALALRELVASDVAIRVDAATLASEAASRAFLLALGARRLGFYVSAFDSRRWNQTASALVAHRLGDACRLVDVEHVGRLAFARHADVALDVTCAIEGHDLERDTLAVQRKPVQRSLVVPVKLYVGPIAHDDLHPGRVALSVRFLAMTGMYATMVIRQLVELAASP